MSMTPQESTVLQFSAVPEGSALAAALTSRESILQMTRQAEEAVLRPADCGCWSHSLRAALASRMARQHALADLADHYRGSIKDSDCLPLADPDQDGEAQGQAVLIRFMDGVSQQPREVEAADIAQLQAAGISDADIVKLTELNAFMAYQLRLVAGLALVAGATA